MQTNPTAEILKRTATYYERHPDAWKNGYHLGVALRDTAEQAGGRGADPIAIVREAIGTPDVVGSLKRWSDKHTVAEAVQLLKNIAYMVGGVQ